MKKGENPMALNLPKAGNTLAASVLVSGMNSGFSVAREPGGDFVEVLQNTDPARADRPAGAPALHTS